MLMMTVMTGRQLCDDMIALVSVDGNGESEDTEDDGKVDDEGCDDNVYE